MAGWKPKNCEIKHPKKYRMSFYDILAENTVKTLCHFVAKMPTLLNSQIAVLCLYVLRFMGQVIVKSIKTTIFYEVKKPDLNFETDLR